MWGIWLRVLDTDADCNTNTDANADGRRFPNARRQCVLPVSFRWPVQWARWWLVQSPLPRWHSARDCPAGSMRRRERRRAGCRVFDVHADSDSYWDAGKHRDYHANGDDHVDGDRDEDCDSHADTDRRDVVLQLWHVVCVPAQPR